MENSPFNILEILKMAIRIEETGTEYYSKAAKYASDEATKNLFQFLAEQEQKHIDTFTAMYNVMKDINPVTETFIFDEYLSLFLGALTDDQVFKNRYVDRILASSSPSEIIQEAINSEKNSILFYTEISNNTKDKATLDNLSLIISEEVNHIVVLNDLLKYFQ